MISGDNFQDGILQGNARYHFSRIPHIWGWATWHREWHRFDVNRTVLGIIQIRQKPDPDKRKVRLSIRVCGVPVFLLRFPDALRILKKTNYTRGRSSLEVDADAEKKIQLMSSVLPGSFRLDAPHKGHAKTKTGTPRT